MANIVSNTGTNYSLYYNLLDYLAGVCDEHPSIAGVGNEQLDEFDERAFPSYPVANININRALLQPNTTSFDVFILIADKPKNKNNESNPITNAQTVPFLGVDDDFDIWANTLAISNDITSVIQRGYQNFNVDGEINCVQFYDRFDSGLAGWELTFTLTTHNDKNRCLFDLYPN